MIGPKIKGLVPAGFPDLSNPRFPTAHDSNNPDPMDARMFLMMLVDKHLNPRPDLAVDPPRLTAIEAALRSAAICRAHIARDVSKATKDRKSFLQQSLDYWSLAESYKQVVNLS